MPFMIVTEINTFMLEIPTDYFQGFLPQELWLILEHEEQWKKDCQNREPTELEPNLLQGNKGVKTAVSDTAYVKLPISSSQDRNCVLDDMNLLARRTHVG